MEFSGIVELYTEEIENVINIAKKLDISPSDEPDKFCEKAEELSKLLSPRISKILKTFAKSGSTTGFLLFQGIPLENFSIPNTPSNNNSKIGEKTILAKIQAIFISLISEMIAYEAEGYGGLFQDVVPAQNMEKIQTSLSSDVELELHTEQAFSKLRPDIFSLACLKGDPDALTYIMPVQSIAKNLSEYEISLLYKPLWKMGVDLSFKLNGNEFLEGDVRGPFAIIQGSAEDPKLVFDQDLIFGITEEASTLVKKIVDLYYTHRQSLNLKSGEIIFIDNHRAVHGRSSFFPKYDGNDRFLIRCFAMFDYESTRYARKNGGRTVSSIYS